MPKFFVHLSFLFFSLTALSGLFMRMTPYISSQTISYENILHGHSHLAILGWAFLGAIIIFFALHWNAIERKRQCIILIIVLSSVTLCMFLAFLYEGYGVYSIVFSTLHIFIEYWAIFFILKEIRKFNEMPIISKTFIKGSLIALFISTLGPFLLGFLGAVGLKETPFFDMAIYFYLHFQYNGWLYLFLMGTFIVLLHTKGVKLQEKYTRVGFWIYFVSLYPSFIAAILWADVIKYGEIISAVGITGQFIGVLFIIIAIGKELSTIYTVYSRRIVNLLIFILVLLFLKNIMDLGLILPNLAKLIFDTRSVIIGYLHFMLLGFVSLFILIQLIMMNVIEFKNKFVRRGLVIFVIGFIMNEFLLFMSGLMSWLDLPGPAYFIEGLIIASGLLFISIIMIWISMFKRRKTKHEIVRV